MNKLNIFKKLSIKKRLAVGLATMGAGLLLASSLGVSAIPFTGDTTVASPVPAFNVFTGNIPAPAPAAGESDFFQARVPANGNPVDPTTPYTDPVTTDCTNGKIVQLHVYVHNGASAAGNNSGASIAHNTKVRVNLPTSDIVNHNAAATISADNATSVTDGVAINCNGQKATLKYVNGSAAQFSLGSAGQVALPDSIVTSGASIRSEQVAGDVWGCWEERVFVVLNVQIVVAPPAPVPVFTCDLLTIAADVNRTAKVSAFSTTATNGAVFKNAVIDWGDGSTPLTTATPVGATHQFAADGTFTITATAHFMVNGQDVTATSPACQKPVTFKPVPPPINPVFTCDKFNIQAEANRMVKVSAFAVTATNGATFSNATINWGDNTPATNVPTINGVVGQTHQFSNDGTFTVKATATFLVNGQEVTASGPQCQAIVKFVPNQVPETPAFSCDLLTAVKGDNRTVTYTTSATASGGATITVYHYNFGDGTPELVTDKATVTHQYAKDGQFAAKVRVQVLVNGETQFADSANCATTVTFTTPPTPPNTPVTPVSTTPTTLVNTGPGSIAAIFAVVTTLGAIAHRWYIGRRLSA